MAYGYWKSALADRQTVFHLIFRKHPFQGGFTNAAGLERAIAHLTMIDPLDPTRKKHFAPETQFKDLLIPVFHDGELIYDTPPLEKICERAQQQLFQFHPGIKRFLNSHQYPVGMEQTLHDLRTKLILKSRGEN